MIWDQLLKNSGSSPGEIFLSGWNFKKFFKNIEYFPPLPVEYFSNTVKIKRTLFYFQSFSLFVFLDLIIHLSQFPVVKRSFYPWESLAG